MPVAASIPLPMAGEDAAVIEAPRFLSDGNRLRIVRILSRRESCLCELIEQLGQPRPLALVSPAPPA